MITANNVTLQRGENILLQKVTFSFYQKYKVGLVGKNGCGKSSLFLLLLRGLEASAGGIYISSKLSIVTVAQEIPESNRLVIEYVIDADIKLRTYEKELKIAAEKKDGQKIAKFYEAIQNIDGFTAKSRAAKILDGLGFSKEDIKQPVNLLSGGWRMRLNIARALFIPSDILLLDEPTNHLDLDAVIWLEKWLQRYSGLLLLVSHDREFLDQIVTHIAHIENKQIKTYLGNYSDFERQRAELLVLQQKQYEKQQKQIKHIESYIIKFRSKATKARQAQSRIKVLEKMQKIMLAHVDSPFSFEFKEPKNLFNPLLTLENISFGYEDNLVLEKISFQLNAGDRIGLLGRNGAGKSTLIKLLAGDLKEDAIAKNKNIKIGYFAQHTLDTLDETKNALAHLQKIAKAETELKLRRFLGGFDFVGDMALMPVKNFSGGEKARLALALIVWQAPNVLLLDEPTNNLDIDMRQALILALQNYDGAVVVVSHDRFLLNQVVEDYYLIANKNIVKFIGDLDEYQKWLLDGKLIFVSSEKQAKKDDGKFQKKQILTITKQLKILEKKIATLLEEISALDKALIVLSADEIQDVERITSLQIKRSQSIKQKLIYEEEWLKTTEWLEDVKSN